jgi:polyhydroxyalkanoate synthesis regulator phasin
MEQILVWVVSGLLVLIGYFLRELHHDFKHIKVELQQMNTNVQEAMKLIAVNEEKGRSGYRLLEQRIEDLEERLDKLENRI